MRKFIERAINKLDKLGRDQIRSLILDVASENELLEVVLQSMTDGILVIGKDHEVLLVNKSAERLLPFIGGDPHEKKVWDALDDREIAQFLRENLEGQERVYDKEFTLDSSGVMRILSCSIMPLVLSGKILGNLVHAEDVTDRRGKEARLRRAESLASLTTLAAGVAHEIKNPLGSIGIHIQLIQKELAKNGNSGTKSIHNYLDVLNEEVERLNGIVIDFLFAVRPMNISPERNNINSVVHDTIEFVKYELEEANIEVRQELSDRLPRLDLDDKYLKQAILNVIKNAISAMPEGGIMTLRTHQDSDFVFLSISDTGTGIKEENVVKIFEPYFTTKEFGSGLGLTVVYKIIKEHGGDISIQTKDGEGTTFTLSFPVPQEERRLIGWESKSDEV